MTQPKEISPYKNIGDEAPKDVRKLLKLVQAVRQALLDHYGQPECRISDKCVASIRELFQFYDSRLELQESRQSLERWAWKTQDAILGALDQQCRNIKTPRLSPGKIAPMWRLFYDSIAAFLSATRSPNDSDVEKLYLRTDRPASWGKWSNREESFPHANDFTHLGRFLAGEWTSDFELAQLVLRVVAKFSANSFRWSDVDSTAAVPARAIEERFQTDQCIHPELTPLFGVLHLEGGTLDAVEEPSLDPESFAAAARMLAEQYPLLKRAFNEWDWQKEPDATLKKADSSKVTQVLGKSSRLKRLAFPLNAYPVFPLDQHVSESSEEKGAEDDGGVAAEAKIAMVGGNYFGKTYLLCALAHMLQAKPELMPCVTAGEGLLDFFETNKDGWLAGEASRTKSIQQPVHITYRSEDSARALHLQITDYAGEDVRPATGQDQTDRATEREKVLAEIRSSRALLLLVDSEQLVSPTEDGWSTAQVRETYESILDRVFEEDENTHLPVAIVLTKADLVLGEYFDPDAPVKLLGDKPNRHLLALPERSLVSLTDQKELERNPQKRLEQLIVLAGRNNRSKYRQQLVWQFAKEFGPLLRHVSVNTLNYEVFLLKSTCSEGTHPIGVDAVFNWIASTLDRPFQSQANQLAESQAAQDAASTQLKEAISVNIAQAIRDWEAWKASHNKLVSEPSTFRVAAWETKVKVSEQEGERLKSEIADAAVAAGYEVDAASVGVWVNKHRSDFGEADK